MAWQTACQSATLSVKVLTMKDRKPNSPSTIRRTDSGDLTDPAIKQAVAELLAGRGVAIFPGSLKSSAQYSPIMAMARLFPE
ncbi:MAG: hypothetical protein ACP5I8_05720 [Phycisphaerae bacterium]